MLISFFPLYALTSKIFVSCNYVLPLKGAHRCRNPFPCVLPCNLCIVFTALIGLANLVSPCNHDLTGTILSVSVRRAGYSPWHHQQLLKEPCFREWWKLALMYLDLIIKSKLIKKKTWLRRTVTFQIYRLAVQNSGLSILKCFIPQTSDFLIKCSWLHSLSFRK